MLTAVSRTLFEIPTTFLPNALTPTGLAKLYAPYLVAEAGGKKSDHQERLRRMFERAADSMKSLSGPRWNGISPPARLLIFLQGYFGRAWDYLGIDKATKLFNEEELTDLTTAEGSASLVLDEWLPMRSHEYLPGCIDRFVSLAREQFHDTAKRGFPDRPFRECLWFGRNLGSVYSTARPVAGVTEADREIALVLRFRMLRVVRDEILKENSGQPWARVIKEMPHAITPLDFKRLLDLDLRQVRAHPRHAQGFLLGDGVHALVMSVLHFDREIYEGTLAKLANRLQRIAEQEHKRNIWKVFANPRPGFPPMYFAAIGKPWRSEFDAIALEARTAITAWATAPENLERFEELAEAMKVNSEMLGTLNAVVKGQSDLLNALGPRAVLVLKDRAWIGPAISSQQAAERIGYPPGKQPSGSALRQAAARAPEGDPLHLLRKDGPARPRGKFCEDAVAVVAAAFEAGKLGALDERAQIRRSIADVKRARGEQPTAAKTLRRGGQALDAGVDGSIFDTR